jgi:hypothetical protein
MTARRAPTAENESRERPAPRKEAARAAWFCALSLTASFARAGPPMASTNYAIARSADDGGGRSSASTNYQSIDFVAEEIATTTAASAHNKIRDGAGEIFFYPGPVLNLTATAGASSATAALSWSSPGYDGGLGALLPGTSYFVAVTTYAVPNVPLAEANVSFSTSATNPGTGVGAAAPGLYANTTFYAVLWTLDADGNVSAESSSSTLVTLADAPSLAALTFLAVQPSSVTVAWTGFSASPPAASSQSAEGFILQASSSDFGALGAGAPTFSSTTYSVLATTLTVGSALNPLNLSSTYYFQVASLNWLGQPNYTTLPKLVYQISQSTGLIKIGIDSNVALSTISVSSMVVTNLGNWPMTFELTASTQTPGTPWSLSTSVGIEAVLLQGAWNTVQPAAAAFATALTTTTVASSAVNYAGNETGFQVAPGASATLWFRFSLPTSTVGPLSQVLQVVAQPVYP